MEAGVVVGCMLGAAKVPIAQSAKSCQNQSKMACTPTHNAVPGRHKLPNFVQNALWQLIQRHPRLSSPPRQSVTPLGLHCIT